MSNTGVNLTVRLQSRCPCYKLKPRVKTVSMCKCLRYLLEQFQCGILNDYSEHLDRALEKNYWLGSFIDYL